ncbi:MAG: hypothetical protein ACEQSB_00105 [Undibacterium sp.]
MNYNTPRKATSIRIFDGTLIFGKYIAEQSEEARSGDLSHLRLFKAQTGHCAGTLYVTADTQRHKVSWELGSCDGFLEAYNSDGEPIFCIDLRDDEMNQVRSWRIQNEPQADLSHLPEYGLF